MHLLSETFVRVLKFILPHSPLSKGGFMKRTILFTFTFFFAAAIALAQTPQVKQLRVSQFAKVTQTIGVTDITVTYHRPGVKGREIWGKLVPYNQVWRAGANNATTVEFSQDVTIAGRTLKAGAYEFFLLPTENEWTVIFNSASNQWGAYSYDSTKNVLTFTVKPEAIPHEEWLSYNFSDLTISSATMSLRWEKLAIPFTITTNTAENARKISDNFASMAAQQASSYARYAYDSKMDWDAAMMAADKAAHLDPNFGNLSLKANLLAQKEMWADAAKTGDEAIKVGKASNANTGNFEKSVAEWKTKMKGKKK